MICKLYNKMVNTINYIMTNDDYNSKESEIELIELIIVCMLFGGAVLLMSWWLVPLRWIISPLGKVTFKCEKKE